MLVKDFFVNSVAISGFMTTRHDYGNGTGQIMVTTGGNTYWIYVDHPPTWEEFMQLAPESFITVQATVAPNFGGGKNDILVCTKTKLPPQVCVSGTVCRPELKQTSKGTVMTFAVSVDKQYIKCECWSRKDDNNFLWKHIKSGNFVSVTGNLSIDSWTDKDGNARSTIKIGVQHLAAPYNGGNGNGGKNQAPSTPPSPTPALVNPTATTPVAAPAVPDTDGVVF